MSAYGTVTTAPLPLRSRIAPGANPTSWRPQGLVICTAGSTAVASANDALAAAAAASAAAAAAAAASTPFALPAVFAAPLPLPLRASSAIRAASAATRSATSLGFTLVSSSSRSSLPAAYCFSVASAAGDGAVVIPPVF